MKFISQSRHLLVIVSLLFLVVASTSAAEKEKSQQSDTGYYIRFTGDLITLKAKDVSMKELLKGIADKTDIRIFIYREIEESVSIDVSKMPIEKCLARLMEDINYAIVWGEDKGRGAGSKVRQLIVFPSADSAKTKKTRTRTILSGDDTQDNNILDPTINQREVDSSNGSSDDTDMTEVLSNLPRAELIKRAADLLINDASRDVRAHAAVVLGGIGEEATVELLAKGLDDKDEWVRLNIVESLDRIGVESIFPYLEKAYKDKDADVSNAAFVALEKMKEKQQTQP